MGKGTPWLHAAEVLREIPYRLMNNMNKVEDPREAIFRHIDPIIAGFDFNNNFF